MSKWIHHGGGVARVWSIRADLIAAVSEVYGTHGEQTVNGKAMFGPFVDVLMAGGQTITLENCITAYDSCIGTPAEIMQEIQESP